MKLARKGAGMLFMIGLAASVSACGGDNNHSGISGQISIDGSSTVFPISVAVAEEFMILNRGVRVTVSESGSGNGITRLIAGELEIADSSRLLHPEELAQLEANGEEAIAMPIAYDGITVVVHKSNDWVTDLTLEELNKIWGEGSTVTRWSEVREGWPDTEMKLYGPGTASGTFEYFTEVVNHNAKESRWDYTASEDDNVLVRGVAGDRDALGYFGFAFYEENSDMLNAVPIRADADSEAIAPSIQTIEDGSYLISREIYILPLKSRLEQEHVRAFIQYYNSEEGQMLVEEVGYVRLPAEKYADNLKLLDQ